MKKSIFISVIVISILLLFSCNRMDTVKQEESVRGLADTVGFAHLDWQMDSIVNRIQRLQPDLLINARRAGSLEKDEAWKVVISPHDDYSYVGYLYPAVLENIKAKTIILFGVAHQARKLGLENQIIFDSFDYWHGPYGNIKISSLRETIANALPDSLYQINDQMEEMEHSLEALLPFIQYYNREIEIVPILVPYMSFQRMNEIAEPLAKAIAVAAKQNDMKWGRDFAIAISTDAVHYGDREWGESNFAFYGSDTAGYNKAVQHEYQIINNCLVGDLEKEKINKFTQYTVKREDYHDYKWTWCGRYSVPFGLLSTFYLQNEMQFALNGRLIGYANSLDHPHLPVDDLRMGVTANANIHHWVGYAAVGYK